MSESTGRTSFFWLLHNWFCKSRYESADWYEYKIFPFLGVKLVIPVMAGSASHLQ
jgi:intracellular septation protein A